MTLSFQWRHYGLCIYKNLSAPSPSIISAAATCLITTINISKRKQRPSSPSGTVALLKMIEMNRRSSKSIYQNRVRVLSSAPEPSVLFRRKRKSQTVWTNMTMQTLVRSKSQSRGGSEQGVSEEDIVFAFDHGSRSFTEDESPAIPPPQRNLLEEQDAKDEWFSFLFYDSPSDFEAEHTAITEILTQEQLNASEKEEGKHGIETSSAGAEKVDGFDGSRDFLGNLQGSDNQATVHGTNTSQQVGRAPLTYAESSRGGEKSNLVGSSLCTPIDAGANFGHDTSFKHHGVSMSVRRLTRNHAFSVDLPCPGSNDALPALQAASGSDEDLLHELEACMLHDWHAQGGDEAQVEDDPPEGGHPWRCKDDKWSSNEMQLPLRILDSAERIAEGTTAVATTEGKGVSTQGITGGAAEAAAVPNSNAAVPTMARMNGRWSYLSQQDKLYLASQPLAELRPYEKSNSAQPQRCILVVFAANDLRVHDNYNLALASMRAHAAGGLPVIALCVLDYRTFAQPSLVGGFFRQSPQRAHFLLDTVAALRRRLEETDLHVPLLIRCGRPEEHVPRLAVELGAVDVFLTTQYAPHERRVHDYILQRVKKRCWVSRRVVQNGDFDLRDLTKVSDMGVEEGEELVEVLEHTERHPYMNSRADAVDLALDERVAVHSVWQSTLVHLDDLQTPVAAMKEGERWYHDDVTTAVIRPTSPYDWHIARLRDLPVILRVLPSERERLGLEPPSFLRGRLPTLEELGYGNTPHLFRFEEVIATQSSHPTAGEEAAIERVQDWLDQGGMTSMLRFAHMRRTNTKMYSQKLSRVSPYIATGALSPRKFYEMLRAHTHANLRDGFVQMQYREALLRLSKRDYWHWMGLRYGDRLFFSYGPHPEETDEIADWRHDGAIVQKWCMGLTGIPFTDAAMRELLGTGFVAHEGRQALVWLLTRGYGQDWRLAAEWLERCSLDFDPFVCYGNCAYFSELMHDDFGEPVRNVHFLAHRHDQTGIYIKKWLPQLSKIPPVYIHRPHILTPRMQAIHSVYIGKNYPYPLKLWQGAHRALTSADLRAYFPDLQNLKGPGYAEAARHGMALMQPEEWNCAFDIASIRGQPWIRGTLLASAFEDVVGEEGIGVTAYAGKTTSRAMDKTLFALDSSGHYMPRPGSA